MKGRSLQSKLCVAAGFVFMAVLCLFDIKAIASPKLMQICTQEENPSVLWTIKDAGEIKDGYAVSHGERRKTPYAVIEEQECEISFAGEVGTSDGISMNTVILLDNSLSISEQNRNKAIQIITQMIQNHMANETFDLYTFSDTLNMVAENSSDYDSLINTVSGITFNDQDSYMLNALNELVDKLRSRNYENGYAYTRIILVSDGVDDDKLGLTFDEVNNNTFLPLRRFYADSIKRLIVCATCERRIYPDDPLSEKCISLIKKCIISFLRLFDHPGKAIYLSYLRHMKRLSNGTLVTCFEVVESREVSACLCQKSDMFPTVTTHFEGIQIRMQKNYDEVLRKLYGDYMQLPPENRRHNELPRILDFGDGRGNVLEEQWT